MRADIHDGPAHNALQAEAGYIKARPQQPSRQSLLHRTAGPYIWVRLGKSQIEYIESASPPQSGHEADMSDRPLSAMCGRLRVGKDFLHARRLVGAAMCSA